VTSNLGELVEVLRQIQSLVLQGCEAFDADPRQRWSIERLWIHAGNLANDLQPGTVPAEVVADLVGARTCVPADGVSDACIGGVPGRPVAGGVRRGALIVEPWSELACRRDSVSDEAGHSERC
jgi:hypothetical protein